MSGHRASGTVLVAVLLISAVAWALLAAAITQAWVHTRLAQGAVHGAVAGAAADAELARWLALATSALATETDAEPLPSDPPPIGACSFRLSTGPSGHGWRVVGVDATFRGAHARREGTARAP
jgi:hypothetical protein